MFLGKFYPEDEEGDGPGISTVIMEHLEEMTKAMSDNVTTKTMLDVESKVCQTLMDRRTCNTCPINQAL